MLVFTVSNLDETAERLSQECVALVAAVEAHRLSEQACGDADANRAPSGIVHVTQ
jgi:hypothetical protein